MHQISRFYLSSFLKNQTYFTPIFVLLLQFHSLTFQQIFWVYTLGSVASFILEIPTGILADLWGRRNSIVLSKVLIFASFLTFGFAHTFWIFVLAQIIYEIGESFRSGTEAAYIFDYLETQKTTYTEVKAKQKFYGRLGESLATLIGGFLASVFGYNIVFFFAALPAFLNILNVLCWDHIKEVKEKLSFSSMSIQLKSSLKDIFTKKIILLIILNITFFYALIQGSIIFIQPYLQDVGLPVAYFGIVYAAALLIAAFLVRYSTQLEKKYNTAKLINLFTFLALPLLLLLSIGKTYWLGALFLFLLILLENMRSPIINTLFHTHVTSKKRATIGSLMALSKALGKIALLPVVGYFADVFSMFTAFLFLSAILVLHIVFLRIRI